MSEPRYTASTITDDALDALYAELDYVQQLSAEQGHALSRAIAERGEQRLRAEQAEELQRIAHETSNRSEAERARAVQRAETAEAALIRAHEWADELDEIARRAHPEATHPAAAVLRFRMDYDPRKESQTP